MAKIESSSARPEKPVKKPSSPRIATPPGPAVVVGHKVLKLAGFVVGFPASVLCVMALIGGLTENGYVRVLGALVLVLAIPLFVADRLLPSHDPRGARGLVSDVLAVAWTLTAFVIAAALGGTTRPLLAREGDRLVKAGYPDVARGAYFLGGFRAQIPGPEPAASTSTSASAPPAASAAPGDAGAPPPSALPMTFRMGTPFALPVSEKIPEHP